MTPLRRIAAASALTALLAAASASAAPPPSPAPAPSPAEGSSPKPRGVLLLVADDLGCDLGCYGNTKIRTPAIDALAAGGVRFTHAFASVSSCSPSRASLYTGLPTHASGQYGLAHGEHNFHTFAKVKGLPLLLRDKGVRTAIIGKNHVQPREVYPWDVEITKGIDGGRNGVLMAEEAAKFLADPATVGKPFLLVMGYTDPHRGGKTFANDKPYKGIAETIYKPEDVLVPPHLPDTPEVRADLAEYCRAVSRLDVGVGKVMEALKAAGRDGDTLVIFLSDNGIPFPGAKTSQWDPGVKLPLIIRDPTRPAATSAAGKGAVNNAMVSWTDITPTILDWFGSAVPKNLPGRSVLPILNEADPKGWDTVFGSHQFHQITAYYPMRMIRTREYKLIVNLAPEIEQEPASDLAGSPSWAALKALAGKDLPTGVRSAAGCLKRPREELYDLRTDPNEARNLAADPAHAAALADLRERLDQWRAATNDPWLTSPGAPPPHAEIPKKGGRGAGE